MKELVTILIPVLDQNLSPFEIKVIQNTINKLNRYPIIFLCAEGTVLNPVLPQTTKIEVQYFPEKYFKSPKSFSKLLLINEFYERFSWTESILIQHLNSWIVKDELHYWCKQGYDYLTSAPIARLNPKVSWLQRIVGLSPELNQKVGLAYAGCGLSLLFTEPALNTINKNKKEAHKLRNSENIPNAESVFWNTIPNRILPSLRKPTRVVQDYFAKHVLNLDGSKYLTVEKLPFALTGVKTENELASILKETNHTW